MLTPEIDVGTMVDDILTEIPEIQRRSTWIYAMP